MKISLSKFYKEVTSSTTVNRKTTEAALRRWKIPFDHKSKANDVVDADHLPTARALWAAEKAKQAAQRAAKNGNGHAHAAPNADDVVTMMARVEKKIDAIIEQFGVTVHK
jgi:hypothetical protein